MHIPAAPCIRRWSLVIVGPIAVLVALAGLFALADPAGAQVASVEERTETLMTLIDVDRTVTPELFEALLSLEARVIETEDDAEEWSARVAKSTLAVEDRQIALDEARRGHILLTAIAADEGLSEEVIAARDQLVEIELATEQALLDIAIAEQALEADEASLERSLARVVTSWNLRQQVVADLTLQVAHIRRAATQPGAGLPDARFASYVELALLSTMNAEDAEANGALFSFGAAGIRKVAPLLLHGEDGEAVAADENTLRWPTIGEVNSRFGMRVHPVYRSYRMHTGLDIDGVLGDPVSSVQSGTVTSASWQGGYGLTVRIDHGNGLSSLYSHLSELGVAEGDVVERGATIGLIGATGTATSAHLHFEIRQDDEPVDPLQYLP